MGIKIPGASTAWKKNLADQAGQPPPPPLDGKEGDLIILVMGPTGVGKSTFIKEYTQNDNVTVGHHLQSCTRDVTWYEAAIPKNVPPNPTLQNRRLILVDTPGFDDTFSDDSDILRRISAWLAKAYNDDRLISGVVYMNDISQKRMFGSTRMNLKMFTKLCGDDAFEKVVLATSQWDNLPSNLGIGEQRERELSKDLWKPLLDNGAKIMRIQNKPADLDAIVAHLIRAALTAEKLGEVMQIQKEIVDLERSIPATQAGRELKYTLAELLKLQKAAQANAFDEQVKKEFDAKMTLAKKQLKSLKLSFGERLRIFFGL
ncbi:P-loop containing nucleoside triphosphate hydrolase protein [Coprinopsis sp. MPI-PUGE-AT-0042]|nr:P-loop containing nucleoside triphosphate hydrolase protein [Coprinopsis sp. MPI-PUGE-AT-0042]